MTGYTRNVCVCVCVHGPVWYGAGLRLPAAPAHGASAFIFILISLLNYDGFTRNVYIHTCVCVCLYILGPVRYGAWFNLPAAPAHGALPFNLTMNIAPKL